MQLVRAAIPGSSSSGNGSSGSASRGKAVGLGPFFYPFAFFALKIYFPHHFLVSLFSPGVGISFVRRAGAGVGADSKFVVKRLVQGSDTAMQGDVEVNDIVIRVRASVPLLVL